MGQNRIKDLLCQESIYDNDTKIFMPGKAVTCKIEQCEWDKNWVFFSKPLLPVIYTVKYLFRKT